MAEEHDPSRIGPGTWNVLHREAWLAQTPESQDAYAEFVERVCSEFPCEKCRAHSMFYLEKNPVSKYKGTTLVIDGTKRNIGMFLWSWRFHNTVNVKLKKAIMDWDTAYNIYGDGSKLVCTKECGVVEETWKKSEKVPEAPRVYNTR